MIRGILLVALTVGTLMFGAATASAEYLPETLIDASPGVDAVAVRPPEEISLNFREPVSAVHVRLFKDDTIVSSSDAIVKGGLAIAPIDPQGPGSYLVDWKGIDAEGALLAGAYVFRVDPRGNNSIAVDREIAGASGALGGLRVSAAAIAAMGVVALLVGVAGWAGRSPSVPPGRVVYVGAMSAAIGSFAAGLTYGVPSDGSLLDVLDVATIPAAAASEPGRAWLTAGLLMGVLPFTVVLGRSLSSRWFWFAAGVVAAVSSVWVAIGLGWLVRLPWPLLSVGLAAAVALWLAVEAGRPVAVAGSLVVALVVAAPIAFDVGGSGASSAVQAGNLLIEASLDPGRSGINELHVYGFDVSGRGASMGPTSVAAYHREMDVGPLDLSVLRAGPNHFLSYRAMLPLSGEWTLAVNVTSTDGGGETATMGLRLR